jgi:transcriptional regulator
MYKMPHFTEPDRDKVLAFMRAHSFVTLIANDGHRSEATQVPVLFDERDGRLMLSAHIMRKTGHYIAIEQNPEVLVLFTGPHCYVSSSWYTEAMGATWNYQTVHVRGRVTFTDEAGTINIINRLTEKYERVQEQPLLMPDLPAGYVDAHVKAIAGLEIEVTDIYPIFKLSQNRDDESYKNIVAQLLKTSDPQAHQIAEEMKQGRPHLF